MKLRQIIGAVILLAIVVGLIGLMIADIGVVGSLIVLGFSALLFSTIALSVWLIFGGADW